MRAAPSLPEHEHERRPTNNVLVHAQGYSLVRLRGVRAAAPDDWGGEKTESEKAEIGNKRAGGVERAGCCVAAGRQGLEN